MKGNLRFTADDVDRAQSWGFNCGPGALCAVLEKTPDEIRPHLLDFEKRGYTNPSLMFAILRDLDIEFSVDRHADQVTNYALPRFGLVRVQWSGPWTRPGVPIRVRYRHSHWIAVRRYGADPRETMVFDINGIKEGWITWEVWRSQLVPWLLEQCEPQSDGSWWPTHSIEITQPSAISAPSAVNP